MVLRVILWRYQKLINQFLLLKYSRLYISAKKRNSWENYSSFLDRENPLWILKQFNIILNLKYSVLLKG